MKNRTFNWYPRKIKCACGNTAVGKMTVAGVRRPVCVWCKKFHEGVDNSHRRATK